MVKGRKFISKPANFFCKNQGCVKTTVGSELSLVSGTYHENKVSVVMEMASFSDDTLLTERSIGAGPPVIIQLSAPDTPDAIRQRETIF
jgi:hypothetical protein